MPHPATPGADPRLGPLYRKITWRLLPFLLLCYVFAYLDRINIGFAKLQMQQDIGISDAVYGLGAGIFFLGYVMFGCPATCCWPASARAAPSAASWCCGA